MGGLSLSPRFFRFLTAWVLLVDSKNHHNLTVGGALSEAQRIVAAAETRAQELLAGAEARARSGYDAGFKQGLEEGRTASARDAVRLIAERGELSSELALEGARLAVLMAQSILGEQLSVAPNSLEKLAARALKLTPLGQSVTILVHPSDGSKLEAAIPNLRKLARGVPIIVEGDLTIANGGCIVRTEFGEVDASVDSLLKAIAERLGING